MSHTHRPLKQIEADIRSAMDALANAPSEAAAAEAYRALGSNLADYLHRANDMNREHWRLRETALKQAQTIADFDIDEITGRTGGPGPSEHHLHNIQFPDVLTVESAPALCIVRLSYGLLNLNHIVELDVKSRTLFTTAGTRTLQAEDVRVIIHHLKLYPAK